MLGQHGLMTKLMFYRGSSLVPTIIQPPQDTKTKVITAPTQSIDITATILDAAGADPIEGAGGRSLLPAMQGESLDRDIAFSELCGLRGEGNYFVMAATERYRYVYDRDNDLACEFFDLENDPDEDHNLVNDPAYEGIRQDIHKDYVIPFLEGKNM
jgi:choline-sulfatase